MATFNSDVYTANQPTNTGKGVSRQSCHLHAVCAVTTAMTTNDVLNMGYLPTNAVVVGVWLKAQSQIDSSTGLTLSLGVTGTAALWISATTSVGRATGVTGINTIATAGALYKASAKTLVIVTCAAAPTTAIAGNIEVDIEYYVEDAVGSQA